MFNLWRTHSLGSNTFLVKLIYFCDPIQIRRDISRHQSYPVFHFSFLICYSSVSVVIKYYYSREVWDRNGGILGNISDFLTATAEVLQVQYYE